MIPTLPNELILRIHSLAEEGLPGADKLRQRSTLELVCKTWYNMIDYYTHLILIKVTDLTRLTRKMSNKKMQTLLGGKTRSLFLDCTAFKTPDIKKFCGLLKWLVALESLEIRETGGSLNLSGVSWTGANYRGPALFAGLERLSNLKHFTLRGQVGDEDDYEPATMPKIGVKTFELSVLSASPRPAFPLAANATLHASFAKSWTALESLELGDCDFVGPHFGSAGVLSALTQLRTLDLKNGVLYMPEGLLTELPASLRSLSLLLAPWFHLDVLNSILPNLEEFDLRDCSGGPRGLRSQTISRLTSVRHLTITPITVSNLSTELLPLKNLTRLDIVGCDVDSYADLLKSEEATEFIDAASGLRILGADRESTEEWGWFDILEVKAAARRKNIELAGILQMKEEFWINGDDEMFFEEEFGGLMHCCDCGFEH